MSATGTWTTTLCQGQSPPRAHAQTPYSSTITIDQVLVASS
jgi:hypothetical protein